MNWYLDVLKNYFVLQGRTRRKEFWMFALINFGINIVIGIVESLIGSPGILATLYGLAIFIPCITVSVRRLHDINRSGWWLLLGFIPVIGTIILIIFFILDGTQGENRYGPDPKTISI